MQEQPREKVQRLGIRALSNQELIALIVRTGPKGQNALQLADQLLRFGPGLSGFMSLDYHELMQIPGIKGAKASELLAVIELSRRMALDQSMDVDVIDQPARLIAWLKKELGSLKQEHFVVIFLNTKNHILGYRALFVGGLDRSIVHPREVFKQAVAYSAARIIVVHNHPSGDVTPSENDYQVTQVLEEAGETMGIPLLDHLIVSHSGFRSLRSIFRKD